jgi:hypothetical protein
MYIEMSLQRLCEFDSGLDLHSDVPGLNYDQKISYPDWGFSWLVSVALVKWWDST